MKKYFAIMSLGFLAFLVSNVAAHAMDNTTVTVFETRSLDGKEGGVPTLAYTVGSTIYLSNKVMPMTEDAVDQLLLLRLNDLSKAVNCQMKVNELNHGQILQLFSMSGCK